MGAAPVSGIALRPFLPADARRCIEIFRASIEELASEDYDADQREAWSAKADDAAAFAERLSASLTLIASLDGQSVGFASLKGQAVLDMLFVDPAFARRGVGAALIDALVRIAEARGVGRLSVDASDTARPLFERYGFVAERRNLVAVGDQWLGNTTMTRAFAKSGAAGEPTTRH
jgi:putative acetyltransferase